MRTDQEIQQDIKEAERLQKEARSQVAYHKKAAVDAESNLIHANLQFEKLKEELRVYYDQYPPKTESFDEKEIRLFKERLPELLKKIK